MLFESGNWLAVLSLERIPVSHQGWSDSGDVKIKQQGLSITSKHRDTKCTWKILNRGENEMNLVLSFRLKECDSNDKLCYHKRKIP